MQLRASSKGKIFTTVAAAAVLIATAGCGSSSKPSSTGTSPTTGSGGGAGKTITVGVLTDVTGPASSGNKSSVQGVQAGVVWAAKHGYTIKYVLADTATSPATALSAAQKLVTQDHVTAVLADSAITFAAAPYLKAHGIPVVGVDQDANEWEADLNMFSVYGVIHINRVSTTTGLVFKMLGATKVGTLGYSISPSSAEAAKSAALSAKAVGLQVPYVNASFPFGGTNVAPVALAMKGAGVDGFTSETDPNTAFSLIAALRNANVSLKVAYLADGYGADTLQAGPGALSAAQNVYFSLDYQPVEMHTAATQEMVSDFKAVGITIDPSEAEYNGYLMVALLVQGLQGAGSNPTQASLISSLSAIHAFTATGLFGSHTLDINDRTGIVSGVDNCAYVAKLSGSKFQLVPGLDPICGTVVPGETVSTS
jgi:ABC-type branched-subunit amino acid transport system substrate-binding protein